MNVEEAILLIGKVIAPKRLTKIQELIIRNSWDGLTYQQMSEECRYELGYLKDLGSKLWQNLSEIMGEKITKHNLQVKLKEWQPQKSERIDWGEAITVESFYGRESELAKLSGWLSTDSCRLVTIWGMGGIGKTSLAVKLVQQVQEHFDYVIWRSLRDRPNLEEVILEICQFISQTSSCPSFKNFKASLDYLVEKLSKNRCLIILDNLDRSFHYEQLILRVAQSAHQSCLLVTSREKPLEISILEGNNLPVRSLLLQGLNYQESKAIFEDKDLKLNPSELSEIVDFYRGNPLFLKITASTIIDVFGANVNNFLQYNTGVIEGIDNLLYQELQRLSTREWKIMFWLAIKREPVIFPELETAIFPKISKKNLFQGVQLLIRRSLIELTPQGYTQQPVIMEFVTARLLDRFIKAIIESQFQFLTEYALLEAKAPDYIRETQIRIILEPLIERLLFYFSNSRRLGKRLKLTLLKLKNNSKTGTGYGIGNLLNLLMLLKIDLTGEDLEECTINQAYLPNFPLQNVNLNGASLEDCVFASSHGNILCIDFSADGNLLITSDHKGSIYIWQVTDFRCLSKIDKAHQVWAFQVKITPDNQKLVSVSFDGVKVWHLESGRLIHNLGIPYSIDIIPFDISPDGEIVAYLERGNCITLQEIVSQEERLRIEESLEQFNCLVFAPTQPILGTGSLEGTMKLWDTNTGECLKTIVTEQSDISAIAFSNDDTYVATGSRDGSVKVWEVNSGECRYIWHHQNEVMSLAFSRKENNILASADADSQICLWNLATGICQKLLLGHEKRIRSLAFANQSWLASGGDDQKLKIWNYQTGRCVNTLQGYNRGIWSMALHPEERWLVTGEDNCTLRLWDLTTGESVGVFQKHSDRIYSLAFSPDGQYLASVSEDRKIKLWQFPLSGSSLITLSLPNSYARLVCFSPKGDYFATGSTDGLVRLWSPAGECLKILSGHKHWVNGLVFDNQGKMLISSSIDGMVKFWNLETGTCVKFWKLDCSVCDIAVSTNWDYLASHHPQSEMTLKLWDLKTEEMIRSFNDSSRVPSNICFSSDGKFLFRAASGHTIKMWEVQTGRCCQDFAGHTNDINSILLTRNNPTLISCSFDGTIRFWNIISGKCQQIIKINNLYEGMRVTNVTGLTPAEKSNLIALGALE